MPAAGTLAIVWAGANDFFDGQKDPTIPAKNIAAAVSALIGSGVKNFLIPNLPDLSKTPFGLAGSTATQQGLHALSAGFDQALSADLGQLTSAAGVHIHTLDTFGLFQNIQANPARFQLSNVTQEGILSGNPSAPGYLFWDDVHPTTAGHGILAEQAAAAVATPEPSSLALLASGLLGLLVQCWRRLSAEWIRMCTRNVVRVGTALLALLIGLARAEEPTYPIQNASPAAAPSLSTGELPPTPTSALAEHPLLAAGCPCDSGDGGTMFDIDVMLGMLLGVRGQAAIYRNPYQAFVVESFYGALLDRLGASEGAGAGGRYYFRRTDRAGCNSVLIGPGVGAFCHFHHELWMVAPTVDVAWVRAIGDRGAWQLGLNAGLGVGVAGDSETTGVGRVSPLFSLFTGFR